MVGRFDDKIRDVTEDSDWVRQVGRYGRLATQSSSPGHLLDHSPDTIS